MGKYNIILLIKAKILTCKFKYVSVGFKNPECLAF